MNKVKADIYHSLIWAICIAVVALGCSYIWGQVINHGNDDKVRIQQIQVEGKK